MSIKSILIPFTGKNTDNDIANGALRIARMFGAQINVIYARGYAPEMLRLSMADMGEIAFTQLDDIIREQAETAENAVREHFLRLQEKVKADKGSAVSALLDIVDGNDTDAIIEWGGVHDLLVVGTPGRGVLGVAHDIAETSLVNTGRPVVMVPGNKLTTIGNRIIIGWNKSSQASRAVANALPFLKSAEKVLIAHVETGAKQGPSSGRLKRYLELHDVDAELTELQPDYRPVGEQLLDEAKNFRADLLVTGAYSRSRMRERLFGGVTQHIFDTAEIPVLMAR